MRVGDRMIFRHIQDYPVHDSMTIGKIYTVLDIHKDFVVTKNDIGNLISLWSMRFISLKESRKQKLNKII